MSHFTVLVIGDNIEEQLAPYQENNMGDCPREYMEFMDKVEEYKEEYETGGRDMILFEGEYYYPWDSKFNQTITEEEYNTAKENGESGLGMTSSSGERTYYRQHVYPEGAEEVFVPYKERFATIEEYVEDMGYEKDEETGKYGYWENPNRKWDWYQVGGRWAGLLKVKDEVEELVAPNFSWGWDKDAAIEVAKDRRVDTALVKEIDWSAIHQTEERYNKAIRFWELKVEGQEPQNKEEEEQLKWDWYKVEYYTDRYKDKETYAKCESSFTTWAVLKDGQWGEKGSMGWWAMSDESHDEAIDWELNFYDRFIKDLPEDTRITIVDCHI